MIKIRYNVFETNSSSTHSLSIKKIRHEFTEEELDSLTKLPIIDILPPENNYLPRYFVTVEEKLRYLYTAYVMIRRALVEDWESDEFNDFIIGIKNIIPSIKFVEHREQVYVIEDLDLLFEEESTLLRILDKDTLLSLLFDGIIVNYSRDLEDPEASLLKNKAQELCETCEFYNNFSG